MSREDAINKTGLMMLQGWALSSVHCSICHSVLVCKNKINYHCPSCDLPVRFESQMEVKADTDEKLIDSVPDQKSLEEEKREWDKSRKARDEISAKLGERMLNGWTLLGESCPHNQCLGTILVKKKDGPMFCVSCESSFEYDAMDDLVAVVDNSAQPSVLTSSFDIKTNTTSTIIPPIIDLTQAPFLEPISIDKDEEDISAIIGSKLLLGWTMLDATCSNPLCGGNVPLMRDKKGQSHCFECKEITDRDGEILSTQSIEVLQTSSTKADNEELNNDNIKRARVTSSNDSVGAVKPIDIVKQKIFEVAQQLQVSQDIRTSIDLAELLSKLAQAVKALEDI